MQAIRYQATGPSRHSFATSDKRKARELRITCVLNATAGSERANAERRQIEEMFSRRGSKPEILVTTDGNRLTDLAHEAAQGGADVVAAGGGDGTINAVATGLLGTDTTLGVLPLGTLNHFAKDAGIPLALDDAVDVICNGAARQIDVGEVNGRIFLNNSSLGLYPWIVKQRKAEQKRGRAKWTALAVAAASVLRKSPLLPMELQVGDMAPARFRTPLLFIGNNRYEFTGGRLGARGCLNAGRLWVCRAPPLRRWGLLRSAVEAILPDGNAAGFEIFETAEAIIALDRPDVSVATDGEVCALPSPLQYRSRPGALRVMVPSDRV